MQLQYHVRSQFERSVTIFHVGANNIESEVELADTIFGLASSYFIRIVEKRCCLSNTMPILRQARLPALRVKLRVQIRDHFARYALILDMSIAVGKAAPLPPKLVRGHLNFARSFNEFLQVLCH